MYSLLLSTLFVLSSASPDAVSAYWTDLAEQSDRYSRGSGHHHALPQQLKRFMAEPDGKLTETPQQLHIVVGDEDGTVFVMWTTSIASNASMVCYNPSSGIPKCVLGTAYTYNPISQLPWVGRLHMANMTSLAPSEKYCYTVGDPAHPRNSTYWTTSQTCFLAPSLSKSAINVFLGGDMGSYQLLGHIVADRMLIDDQQHGGFHYDAFWLIGDISYSTLDPPRLNFELYWDIFMVQEAPLVNHVPLLVTYGNHDFSGGDSGAFINRYRNPRSYGGNANFYWAYRHGPVLFVSMCTEIAINPKECTYGPGTKQTAWLEGVLSTVNRTITPWVILAGHRPMYSSDASTDSGPLQSYIEPLLRKYAVDLEVAGHMHCTEVVAPVYNGVTNMTGVKQTGPTSWVFDSPTQTPHFTIGNLGGLIEESYVQPQPSWSLYRRGTLFDDSYGYGRLFANATSLHVEVVSHNGTTMWDVWIRKPL